MARSRPGKAKAGKKVRKSTQKDAEPASAEPCSRCMGGWIGGTIPCPVCLAAWGK